MVNNIGVTLLNKAAFATVDFKYPFFLSAVHMTCNALGSQLLFWTLRRQKGKGHTDTPSFTQQLLGNVQRQTLDAAGQRLILAFSVIFSLNIAIGNVSLRHVTVNFNQVMRSLVPGVAMWMGMCLGKKFTLRRQLAVVPVMVCVRLSVCVKLLDYQLFVYVCVWCFRSHCLSYVRLDNCNSAESPWRVL